jgi:septation ring formation regulator EzrA
MRFYYKLKNIYLNRKKKWIKYLNILMNLRKILPLQLKRLKYANINYYGKIIFSQRNQNVKNRYNNIKNEINNSCDILEKIELDNNEKLNQSIDNEINDLYYIL